MEPTITRKFLYEPFNDVTIGSIEMAIKHSFPFLKGVTCTRGEDGNVLIDLEFENHYDATWFKLKYW